MGYHFWYPIVKGWLFFCYFFCCFFCYTFVNCLFSVFSALFACFSFGLCESIFFGWNFSISYFLFWTSACFSFGFCESIFLALGYFLSVCCLFSVFAFLSGTFFRINSKRLLYMYVSYPICYVLALSSIMFLDSPQK